MYAALTVVQALGAQRMARPRCVGLIVICQESSSLDLPACLELLAPRLGQVQLIACLDFGYRNYEQLWVTTSLRGLVGGVLTVEVLQEGVHLGMASGLVPSSFCIARKLLNRFDDLDTGHVLPASLHATIPQERIEQAHAAGAILGDSVWKQFPWVGCNHRPDVCAHAMPTTTDPVQAILNRACRPALSVVSAEHLPGIVMVGNVLRPKTSLKLSLRLLPSVDGERAAALMEQVLEADAPYNARVSFSGAHGATGWNAPRPPRPGSSRRLTPRRWPPGAGRPRGSARAAPSPS